MHSPQVQFEQLTEMIRALPPEDFERLKDFFEKEKTRQHEKQERWQRRAERYQKSVKWLAENKQNYLNQWVCLDGDKLISHGTDALKVDAAARAVGIKSPFLEHIVADELPWGGW